MADENYAIVVGLNHYPGITPLLGPENDAKWFHGWLIKNGLVEKKNATLILSSAFTAAPLTIEAKPDTVAIDQAFERLLRIGVANDKVGKRLYLFFSGHGFSPGLNDAALLMANCEASLGITGHYVNAVHYADFFAKAAYFDEIALFMDCCRDDLWQAPVRIAPWQVLRSVDGANVKRFYGLATKWARKAREAATPAGPVHGHFTRALQAALEGGAVGKDTKLTTGALLAFCTNYVQVVIKRELVKQNLEVPEPQFVQKDDFEIATGLTPTSTSVSIKFSPASQASKTSYTLFGGSKPQVLLNNTAGADPWVHTLEFGHYSIFDPNGKQVAEFDTLGESVEINV
jgi:hypothetical protein